MLFKKKIFDENNKVIKRKGLKFGIAFGGGGARGIAHIGVIKALEELGIEADFVAGTSVGSLVGSLYSAGFSSNQMINKLKSLRAKDIRDSKFLWKPSNSENIEQLLKSVFGKDVMFSELKIPLTIVAVNIKDGKQVNITSGSVSRASAGSCAVPGVFSPVVYDGMHLVDGGLMDNVPADIVRYMGADVVLAIDVNKTRGQGTDSLKTIDVLKGSLGIIMQTNVTKTLHYADIVITPNMTDYSSSKLGDVDGMIQRGYDIVMSNKAEIIKLVTEKPKKRIKSLWDKLLLAKEKHEKKLEKQKIKE